MDLVLLDLSLPEVPGAAVLRGLREHPATSQAHIIVMLPVLDVTTLVDVLGADGFLHTPVVHAELLAALQALAHHEAPLAAARPLANQPPSARKASLSASLASLKASHTSASVAPA